MRRATAYKCVSVKLDYDYDDHPLYGDIPFMSAFLPGQHHRRPRWPGSTRDRAGRPPARPAARAPGPRRRILMLTAIALPVLLLMTSFAIDLGRQRAARRTMQAKADVIALDLARLIDGAPPANSRLAYSAPLAGLRQPQQRRAGQDHSRRSGARSTRSPRSSSPARAASPTPSRSPPTTTQTTSSSTAPGSATRSAVAASNAIAGFTIGSFAAAINPLNPNDASGGLLNALLGDALNTSVLGYSGLATANLDLPGDRHELGLRHPQRARSRATSAPTTSCRAQAEILRRRSGNAAQVAVARQHRSAVPNSPLRERHGRPGGQRRRPAARTPPSPRPSTSSTS